jgi:hypothetical protein
VVKNHRIARRRSHFETRCGYTARSPDPPVDRRTLEEGFEAVGTAGSTKRASLVSALARTDPARLSSRVRRRGPGGFELGGEVLRRTPVTRARILLVIRAGTPWRVQALWRSRPRRAWGPEDRLDGLADWYEVLSWARFAGWSQDLGLEAFGDVRSNWLSA